MTNKRPAAGGAKRAAKAKTEPAKREPNQAEREAMKVSARKMLGQSPRVALTIEGHSEGTTRIGSPHNDGVGFQAHLMATLGTRSHGFTDVALAQLLNAATPNAKGGEASAEHANAGLALLAAIDPKDELEAAIGLQILAAHTASLEFLNRARLNAGQHFEVANTYAGIATKLSRTMATHVETLTKLRSGGKQTHEVRYIYVNGPAAFGPGAKAAAAYGGGGGDNRNPGQSQAPQLGYDAGEPCPQVWREDPEGHAVPGTEGQGEAAMSDARRAGWGAEG